MKTIVVTGGIGCGKSAFSAGLAGSSLSMLFRFCSDEAVSKLYEDEQFLGGLAASLGREVLKVTSVDKIQLNRDWLRQYVLPVVQKRKILENLTHGRVLQRLEIERTTASRHGAKVFVAEVPLHYEIGEVISADLVIVVAASRSVQVRRMMDNRGLDEATTRAFLDAQWPIEAKVEKADAVIWNDGDPSALERQTLLLANLLNIE